jgi:hypothetical protein
MKLTFWRNRKSRITHCREVPEVKIERSLVRFKYQWKKGGKWTPKEHLEPVHAVKVRNGRGYTVIAEYETHHEAMMHVRRKYGKG